ncbi:hypothetical protein L596_000467 [Steinernema carpocapsae]|uniref:Uncharacterized protein n=1 Tax=Steinernema carpocapsae TaxID=34508 RepID=A0A4U8UKL6_STECR|nr:hypothetical protein L596_000467 [Steinernema carpocapsae]
MPKSIHFLTKAPIVPPFGLIRLIYGDTVLGRYNWILEVVGISHCPIGPLLCLPPRTRLCLCLSSLVSLAQFLSYEQHLFLII